MDRVQEEVETCSSRRIKKAEYEENLKQENSDPLFQLPSLSFRCTRKIDWTATFFEMLHPEEKNRAGRDLQRKQASTVSLASSSFQRYVPHAVDQNAPSSGSPHVSYEDYYKQTAGSY
jgi:hypothetical protein